MIKKHASVLRKLYYKNTKTDGISPLNMDAGYDRIKYE